MKLLAPWIFLILYILALARPLAPLLEYQANRDFFVEVLCINKAKPELKCNGQCALTQKLKKAFNDETLPISVPNTIKLDDYPIGFISLFRNSIRPEVLLSISYSDASDEIIVIGYSFEIFHPPCVA